MQIQIDYAAFVKLCRVQPPTEWAPGFHVKHDGVYVTPAPDDVLLTPTERAGLAWHPTGDLTRPALRFPCSLNELQDFLDDSGNYPVIDSFEMADFVLQTVAQAPSDDDAEDRARSASPTERDNLMKMLGGMALLIAEKRGQYRRGENPNASAIAEAVVAIIERLPSSNAYGLSAENIRKKLSEAVRLLVDA
ncbi:hypothetical protein [Crenobacter cavernae]|uniref:Uncharacterized protein n=1 Tax=Crenobacter cavernae TaxID=2290923 RepID=A0A345Y7R7_9NEIS|nr:hypothetical protein [Crenobacter cavernae]AXK39969.1 hypothetical protein DWG20_11250 [Crenobacter cavernae]